LLAAIVPGSHGWIHHIAIKMAVLL